MIIKKKQKEESMKVVMENKPLKLKLLKKGYNSLKEYCEKNGIEYWRVRMLLSGAIDGSRSQKNQKIKQQLVKDFGEEIFV